MRLGSGCNLFPVPVAAATAAGIFYCFSLCKAIRNRRLISDCLGLPSSAARMSASVRLLSLRPMWVVLAFVQARLASLSLMIATSFAGVFAVGSTPRCDHIITWVAPIVNPFFHIFSKKFLHGIFCPKIHPAEQAAAPRACAYHYKATRKTLPQTESGEGLFFCSNNSQNPLTNDFLFVIKDSRKRNGKGV